MNNNILCRCVCIAAICKDTFFCAKNDELTHFFAKFNEKCYFCKMFRVSKL